MMSSSNVDHGEEAVEYEYQEVIIHPCMNLLVAKRIMEMDDAGVCEELAGMRLFSCRWVPNKENEIKA